VSDKLIIRLEFVYPPIPDRRFDWSAALDGYEPPDPLGYGPTMWDAVRDLIDQLEDKEEAAENPPEPAPLYDTLEEKKQSYE
jgi:hypothetical protein